MYCAHTLNMWLQGEVGIAAAVVAMEVVIELARCVISVSALKYDN